MEQQQQQQQQQQQNYAENHSHNILRLFDVWPNFPLTTSETKRNY